MRKRGARPLKELYDLTDRITEPEITPVLEGSCRIQGPVDEPDHVLLRANSGRFPGEKRYTFVNENLRPKAESGTCNVCSAPCSSCMHLNRAASVMESNIACPFPGNTFGRKEADSCSFIGVDGYKSRTCDDNQHTASETSNLLGTSSSHDSYSENAESKATLRASVTYVASDAVDMLPKVSSSAEVGDALLPEKNNVTVHSLVSSQSHITSDLVHKAFLSQDEEQCGSECHGDKISCITAVRDANAPVLDHIVDLDKKDASCSSASTSSFLAKEIEDVVLVDAARSFRGHEIEESQSNPRRPDTCHKESLQKKSIGSNSANAGVSDKPELPEFPLSKNIPSTKAQSPCFRSQEGYSFQHNADSKDLEGNLSSHFQVEIFECSMENAESSLRGPLAADSVNERKLAALPNHEDRKSNYISGNSSVALKDTDPCFETEIGVDGSSGEVMKCSTIIEQFENSNPSMEAYKMQGPQVQPQLNVEGENSESDSGLDDVKVCDICGDAGREVLLAICSRCSDGAEHIYCMRKMLDKLPEGDWLCEECKAKEDIEIQKLDKSETASGTSKPTCLNENSQHFASSFNPKLLPKLNTKTVDLEARAVIKGPQSPQISSTRHADNLVDSSVTSKKASEASGGSIGTASPRKKTVLSRESSFKNLDMGKVKPVNMRSSFGGQSANNAPAFSRLQTSLGSNSFKVQTQLQSPRVPVSRSNSLNNSSLKRSPKVKQIMENVPRKLKPTRESTSGDSRKEGIVRTMTKSTSFKSECSNRSNVESLDKTQSLNPSRGEDSSGFGSQSSNGVCNSVDQKACQVPKDVVRASSTATDRTCSKVDQCGVTQAAESALHNDKTKESTIRDDKTKESTLFSSSKQVVSGVNRILRCQRCNETGHATQFCPIVKLSPSALKPSAERNLKEGFKKSNKWKVAAEATNSKSRGQKNNKLPDKSEEFQIPSANLSCGAASKDILSSTSSCQGDLPFLERTTDGQEITRGSDAEPSKTTVNDMKQQAMHPREASYVSTASDSNVILTISDVSNVTSSLQILPDQASILANSLRASAIPELESIWQGGFEVLRTGRRLPEPFDGIQAHLSTCASPKVPEVVAKFPCKVQLEEIPRISSWPSQFQGTSPKEDNIALFFFAKDIESYEKNYINLLENMLTNDLALRGNIDGVELLIFPSNILPANSQCWNKLFFLWGIFRGRRTNCLEAIPGSQKKPCGFISTDSLVQDLPSQLINDVSNSQKIDSCDVRDMEVSWCDRSSKTKTVMSTTSANCWPISSSSGVDDGTRNTGVSPLAGNSLYQVAVDNKLPSECTLFPVSCSLKGMSQLPSLLSSFPESRRQLSSKISCREGNIDATYLNNSGEGGKIAGPPSHTHANNVQTSFRALPANTDSSNCRQGAEGSRSEEKMREKEKSMRSEAALEDDPRENPTEIDHLSWESKPNRKRAHSSAEMASLVRSEAALEDPRENLTERGHLSWESRPSRKNAYSLSSEMASLASSETSESTDDMKLWKEKANNMNVEDKAEYKKMKRYGEGHSSISFRDENLSSRSSSKVHPVLSSFLNEQQHRGGVREEPVMPENSIGAERCFFPVGLGPLRDTKLDSVTHAEDLLESNGPFLELALGSKKKSGKQKEVPLLFDLNGSQDRSSAACSAADEEQKSVPLLFPLDRIGSQDRLPGPAADGDASLSLSLGFPSTHAKPILKTEQLMPDGPRVNTSLILFSGFPYT